SIPYSLHRPLARPALEVAFAPVLPGFHFAAVKPEEVEALSPVSDVDHLGLRRMERQLQAVQDNLDPPERLFCLCFRPAQQNTIIGIPNQLTQLATAVLPEPI